MQGRLKFQSAADPHTAHRAMTKLRSRIEREDVHFIIDEPMHLQFRRPIATRRSVFGVISTCNLECSAEPGGYVIDYSARIKPVLLLLPLILMAALATHAIVDSDLVSAIMLLVAFGTFYTVYRTAVSSFISFLRTGATIDEDDDDVEEDDGDDDDDNDDDDSR